MAPLSRAYRSGGGHNRGNSATSSRCAAVVIVCLTIFGPIFCLPPISFVAHASPTSSADSVNVDGLSTLGVDAPTPAREGSFGRNVDLYEDGGQTEIMSKAMLRTSVGGDAADDSGGVRNAEEEGASDEVMDTVRQYRWQRWLHGRRGSGGGRGRRGVIAREDSVGDVSDLGRQPTNPVHVSSPGPGLSSVGDYHVEDMVENEGDDMVITSLLSWPLRELGPADWQYYPVDCPHGTSRVRLMLTPHWTHKSNGPLLCVRKGSLPLPSSALQNFSEAVTAAVNASPLQTGGCTWFREPMDWNLTGKEVGAGVWWLGVFSDAADTRTQTTMIERGGLSFSFSIHVAVYSCPDTLVQGGPGCTLNITPVQLPARGGGLHCAPPLQRCEQCEAPANESFLHNNSNNNESAKRESDGDMVKAGNRSEGSMSNLDSWMEGETECVDVVDGKSAWRFYWLRIESEVAELATMIKTVSTMTTADGSPSPVEGPPPTHPLDEHQFFLELFVWNGGIPTIRQLFRLNARDTLLCGPAMLRNGSLIDGAPLENKLNSEGLLGLDGDNCSMAVNGSAQVVVSTPKLGWWYIGVRVGKRRGQVRTNDTSEEQGALSESSQLCFNARWKMWRCISGYGGLDCNSDLTHLQRVLARANDESYMDSHYVPESVNSSLWSPPEGWFDIHPRHLPSDRRRLLDGKNPMKREARDTAATSAPGTPGLQGNLDRSSVANRRAADIWRYFSFHVARGASGTVLTAELRVNCSGMRMPGREHGRVGAAQSEQANWVSQLELYARHGAVPTARSYDVRVGIPSWDVRYNRSRSYGSEIDCNKHKLGNGSSVSCGTAERNGWVLYRIDLQYPLQGMWYLGVVWPQQRQPASPEEEPWGTPPSQASPAVANSKGSFPGTRHHVRHQEENATQRTQDNRGMGRISGVSESPNDSGSVLEWEPAVQLQVQMHGCPSKCSNHGVCQSAMDGSGLHLYNYCSCGRTRGGVDCSVEVMGGVATVLSYWMLVVSNAAALAPALWSISQKLYLEGFIYTASGMFSAIYHSCDDDGWCAARYDTLQFADFFLSFLAILVTCVYISFLPRSSKYFADIIAAVVTAVIAKDEATSGWNILIVVALGLFGLALGLIWRLVQYIRVTAPVSDGDTESHSPPRHCCKKALISFLAKLESRYQWEYFLLGLLLLFLAVLSLIFENPANYWMLHSSWHVLIFTATFMFLLSTDLSGLAGPWEGMKNSVCIFTVSDSDHPFSHSDDPGHASTQSLLVSKLDASDSPKNLLVSKLQSGFQRFCGTLTRNGYRRFKIQTPKCY